MLPISLCMIVKNEENNLGKCLNKVINFVDEIVIVDTGSTDKTKEIACKYTDKVYDFDWVDDFSKARNFSVSKAANDWILVLDADEFLVSFDKHQVQNFMLKYEKSIGRIERIEIISQKQQSQEDKKAVERISRLFNKNYYCYEGLVHEQITPKEGIISTSGIVNITVNHTGYIKNVVNEKKKWERNKRLLKKSIQKNPNDPYLYYHMGKINYLTENYSEAVKLFKKAIELDIDFSLEYAQDMVITYGYSLLNLQQYKDALKILEYETYFRNFADYYFVLALIYMNMGCFEKAINSFLKCIGKTEKIIGTSSYLPNYNIGVIYEVLGDYIEALSYYGKSGQYLPASVRIGKILKNNNIKSDIQLLIEKGNLIKAKQLLRAIEKVMAEDAEIYSLKAVVLIMENNLEEAKSVLKKGLLIAPDDGDLLYNLEYLYEIEKNKQLTK